MQNDRQLATVHGCSKVQNRELAVELAYSAGHSDYVAVLHYVWHSLREYTIVRRVGVSRLSSPPSDLVGQRADLSLKCKLNEHVQPWHARDRVCCHSQHCPRAKRRSLDYSDVDLAVFRPAWATCCTDEGEIWLGRKLAWRSRQISPSSLRGRERP